MGKRGLLYPVDVVEVSSAAFPDLYGQG
jgi:hypothetical protein